MIASIAQSLLVSAVAWLSKMAVAEVSKAWDRAKAEVARLEGNAMAKEEKAKQVTRIVSGLIPDKYEDRANQVIKILIEAAIIYVRFSSPAK
jgi:hypothetical protein